MTTQVAAKLPEALVSQVDRLVARGAFHNRSHAIRQGLEILVTTCEQRDLDRHYRDALATMPETDQELTEARRLAIEAIEAEPWERWW